MSRQPKGRPGQFSYAGRAAVSFSVDAPEPPMPTRLAVKEVVIDGLVVLKIIKHCQENFPVAVAGRLLGWQSHDVVEATYSFPFPKDDLKDDDKFEDDYLQALKSVQIDFSFVGWYQSTYLGSYFTRETINHQLEYQEEEPNSVVIIYDGVRTSQGSLSLKALRLSDSYMEAAREAKKLGGDPFLHFSASEIFEEVPLRIRNPHLIQAMLLDLVGNQSITPATRPGTTAPTAATSTAAAVAASNAAAIDEADIDFARLDLNAAPYLEKHLEFLSDTITTYLRASVGAATATRRADAMRKAQEEAVARRHRENEARRAEGKEPLPEEDFSRNVVPEVKARDPIETLLMSAQISNYCAQINKFSGTSFGKLFLAGSIHK